MAKRRSCRVCGCTDMKACDGGCTWVDVDLCSACLEGAKCDVESKATCRVVNRNRRRKPCTFHAVELLVVHSDAEGTYEHGRVLNDVTEFDPWKFTCPFCSALVEVRPGI